MLNWKMRPGRGQSPLLALLLAGSLLLVLWHGLKAQTQPTPPPYDPAAVPTPAQPPAAALGAPLYQENCAPCHGPAGNSDGPTSSSLPAPPPKFADAATVWERSPGEYFHITKFGRLDKLMPPWSNRLSDDQIWQAVYYAWSLHTDQAQVQAGAERYAQTCASCHGLTGAGDGPDASGALPDFSDAGAMSLRTQAELAGGWRLAHAEIGQDWSETERRTTLDYLRTFSYLPPWESAYRPGAGQVNGAIVQGTSAGAAVGSLPVTLTVFLNFAPVQTFSATADAAGNFTFSELATDEGVAYIASTDYAGVRYNSTVYQLTSTTPTATITLPVYETSDDGSAVHVNRANWLVDFEPGGVRVGVILGFSNQSDRTFIGQPGEGVNGAATLVLATPPGATEIEFNDGVLGGRYQQVGDMIYDVAPVPPGEEARQLIYSYLLPFAGDSVTFEQRFLYPVGSLNLLVTDLPGLEVAAPGLTFVGNETVQNIEFRRWEATGLRNPVIPLELSGLIPAGEIDPRALTTASGAGTPVAVGAPPLEPTVALAMGGLLVLALAGVLYWPLRRQAVLDHTSAIARQQDQLIDQIAALDDQHAAGALADAAWLQERAQLKGRLLAVAQELAQKKRSGDRG